MNIQFLSVSFLMAAIAAPAWQGGIAPPPPPPGAGGTQQKPASGPVPLDQGIPGLGRPFPVGPAPTTRPAQGAEPRAVFTKMEFEFGTVDEGQTFELTTDFENKGKGPLVIAQVNPGCGCTVAGVQVDGKPYTLGDPIPVGSKGKVIARLNTEGYGGADKHTKVDVFTNDPSYPELPEAAFGLVRLNVHANIQKRFVFEPPDAAMNFNSVSAASGGESYVIIKSTRNEPFQIAGYDMSDPMFEFRAEPLDDSATRWKVTGLVAPGSRFGNFMRTVTIITKPDGGSPPKFNAVGRVHGPIDVDPMQVSFIVVAKGRTATKNVILRNTNKNVAMKPDQIRFLDPLDNRSMTGGPAREHQSPSKDHLIIRPKELEPGKLYQLEVVVADTMPPGTFNTILSIRTGVPGSNENGSDELRIPITGMVR